MIFFGEEESIEKKFIDIYSLDEGLNGNYTDGEKFYGDDNQENFASDNINIFFEPTINKEDSTKAEAFSTEKTSNSTDVKGEKEKEKENKKFEITKEPKKNKDLE